MSRKSYQREGGRARESLLVGAVPDQETTPRGLPRLPSGTHRHAWRLSSVLSLEYHQIVWFAVPRSTSSGTYTGDERAGCRHRAPGQFLSSPPVICVTVVSTIHEIGHEYRIPRPAAVLTSSSLATCSLSPSPSLSSSLAAPSRWGLDKLGGVFVSYFVETRHMFISRVGGQARVFSAADDPTTLVLPFYVFNDTYIAT